MYSKQSLKYLKQLRESGLTWKQVTQEWNKKFHKETGRKSKAALRFQYESLKVSNNGEHEVDIKKIRDGIRQCKINEYKAKVAEFYVDYIKKYRDLPSINKIEKHIKGGTIKNTFGDIRNLQDYIKTHFHKLDFDFGHDTFNKINYDKLLERVKKHKVLIVSSIVENKPVDEKCWKSIQTFTKSRNALDLYFCIQDSASKTAHNGFVLDKKIVNNMIIDDIQLNKNCMLLNILTSAKQLKHTTGLQKINKEFTKIIPGTKLEFTSIPSHKTHGARAIVSTGAITEPDYTTDYYMSKRTAKMSQELHDKSAIIIELVDNKRFHIRPIEFADDGSFCSLGKRYMPNGRVKQENAEAIYLGDMHVWNIAPTALGATKQQVKLLKPKNIIVGDILDCTSITHHDVNKKITRANKASSFEQTINLEVELNATHSYVEDLLKMASSTVYLIQDNHSEHINKWLESGRWIDDPINFWIAHELLKCMGPNGHYNPFRYYIENHMETNSKKLKWINGADDEKIEGILISQHGHSGPNGAKGTLHGLSNFLVKAIIGHSHAPGISFGIWQVGVLGNIRMDYNKNQPSSWMWASAAIYRGGTREMLIINDDGKWKLDDEKKIS